MLLVDGKKVLQYTAHSMRGRGKGVTECDNKELLANLEEPKMVTNCGDNGTFRSFLPS